MPLLYLDLSSIHLLICMLHAKLILLSATFFSSSLLLLPLVIPRLALVPSGSTGCHAVDAISATVTYRHAGLVQLLRYAAGRAGAQWL